MQKTIRVDQILAIRNKSYPLVWKKIIESVNESLPILYIDKFGAVAFIENNHYLLIEEDLLNGYEVQNQMASLQQEFLCPQSYRLTFHNLSQTQKVVLSIFSDYIAQSITKKQSLYTLCIDMDRLGKIYISKNTIEFINSIHRWTYQCPKKVVYLPRLIDSINKPDENKQRMSRKFSISVKKYSSVSMKKSNENKKGTFTIKKSSSTSKLNNSLNKSLRTDQKISLQIQKQATNNYQNILKDRSKTQAGQRKISSKSKLQLHSKQGNQKLKLNDSSKPYFHRQSREKSLSKQSNRRLDTSIKEKKIQFQLKPDKKTLKLQGNKTPHLFDQRKKLVLRNSFQNDERQMIYNFILRATSPALAAKEFKKIQFNQLQNYLSQLCSIFNLKRGEIEPSKLKSAFLEKYESKKIGKITKMYFTQIENLKYSIGLSHQNLRHVKDISKMIDKVKSQISMETTEFIVNFEKYEMHIHSFTINLQQYLKLHKLTKSKISVPIAILLHQLFQFIILKSRQLIHKMNSLGSKVIKLKVRRQDSYEKDIDQLAQQFRSIFIPLSKLLEKQFKKYLWLQSHQVIIIDQLSEIFKEFISSNLPFIKQNLLKFKTADCRSILNGSYNSEKEGLTLIKKLQELKRSLQEEASFKSLLSFPGIIFDFTLIKQIYFDQIDHKFKQIYNFFYQFYQKSENELNNRLKTIIVINVQYLSDYKCRQYRQEIEQHYKNLIESLMLLIYHFYYLLKQSQISGFLRVAFMFKQQIKQNFHSFNQKLQQYRNISNKTIKMLQAKNKQLKQIYQQLTQKLKKIITSLTSQKSILQYKIDIMKIDSEFQAYCVENKKLVQSMKENQMVYWEDDQFFINNINLLKLSISFIEGKSYRLLFNTSIGQLTIDQVYSAFEQLSEYIKLLAETKLQKLFKPNFTLIQSNLLLAQILLYKQYTEFQLLKCQQNGIEIQSERSSKMFAALKRIQNIDKKRFERIVQIYRQSRLNQFNLCRGFDYSYIKLLKAQDSQQIYYISNLEEIKEYLTHHNTIKSAEVLTNLNKVEQLYIETGLFFKMINLISSSGLPDRLRESIIDEIGGQYSKLLNLTVKQMQIQKFQAKLQQQKTKYMQIYYHQKINLFNRYALCSIKQLVHLSQWRNNTEITRNIKYIFRNVDDVQFDNEGNIRSFIVAKDTIVFSKPFNIFENQGEKAKMIYLYTENYLRESLTHSEYACIYIKLLIWHIYFTQQVELSFMTDISIKKVREQLQQIIVEIANQIRYDIKFHHKSYQITQMTFFVDHLAKLDHITSTSDFEWVSTIRYYQKLKIVKVQQHDRTHDYSFEIKKPLNYDPNFQLEHSISYGLGKSTQYYEISAYILGKPYFTFEDLNLYGFKYTYTALLNIIKKFEYFVRIMVKPQNFKSVNYFHKKILQFSLKKSDNTDQQPLNVPVYFQYESESLFPLCFPQKYRNFSNPQFSYDLSLVLLLQLNKHQDIMQKRKIDMDVLMKVMNIINIKKNLTLNKTVGFVNGLSQFLIDHSDKQEIYRYCYKYFMVNYQVDDNQLTEILKKITKTQQMGLDDIRANFKIGVEQFIQSPKRQIIIYGPLSHKTFSIKQDFIPLLQRTIKKDAFAFIEGFHQYRRLIQTLQNKAKVIIQQRFIYDIEPSTIPNALLYFCNELSHQNIQQMFYRKIILMKLEGNSNRLWKKLMYLYEIYIEIDGHISLLGITELILSCLQRHISNFLDSMQSQVKQYYKMSINKQTIRIFLIIAHEIFYYQVHPSNRKKFTEKLKALPFMEEYRGQQLYTITCKDFNCEKIINFIKKQKLTFKSIGNYIKQFLIIKNYLEYHQPIGIYFTSPITQKLVKQEIGALSYPKINITLNQQYLKAYRSGKFTKVLYIIHDVHLQTKNHLTFIKASLQSQRGIRNHHILIAKGDNHEKYLKNSINFKFSQLQAEQIYKFQSKQGIVEQAQAKSRSIWKNNFFKTQITYLTFLLNISIKLPSQYYKKYYARHLFLTKFTPQILAIKTITENQQFIKKYSDLSILNVYLIDQKGQHQQLSQAQISRKIDKIVQGYNFTERIIIKDYYKDLIPFVLIDKIYIIKEDICILPFVISQIHERKYYCLNKTNFINDLIDVIDETYQSQKQFSLIICEPLTSSVEFSDFFNLYLKGTDIISYYQQLRQYAQFMASKQEYVYRLTDQSITVRDKINEVLHNKMKLIISQPSKSSFKLECKQLYLFNIVYLNCSLVNSFKKSIGEAIITKIIQQNKSDAGVYLRTLSKFIINLIQSDLLSINQIQPFLNDLFEIITSKLHDTIKIHELFAQKKKLYDNLRNILSTIKTQFEQIEQRKLSIKQFLKEIFDNINKQQVENQLVENQIQSLYRVRDLLIGGEQKIKVEISEQYEEKIYQQMKEVFRDQIYMRNKCPILTIKPQFLKQVFRSKQLTSRIEEIRKKCLTQKREATFILIKYIKYILQFCQVCTSIQTTSSIFSTQANKINYFYLLDVGIEVKSKQEHIQSTYKVLVHKKVLISNFINILTILQHIDIEQDSIAHNHIYKGVNKILRNYIVSSDTFKIQAIFKRFDNEFLPLHLDIQQSAGRGEQDIYEQLNTSFIMTKRHLIVFDPYCKLQAICYQLAMKIIYVGSEYDLEELYDYKFKMTIFCIKLSSIDDYFRYQQLINNCISIISKKHSDLKENIIQKLVIQIDCPQIISEIKEQFSVINLDYTFIKFYKQMVANLLQQKYQINQKNRQYIEIKSKLKAEIQLIKTLNPQEIALYMIKLQPIIQKFQEKYRAIKTIFQANQTNTNISNVTHTVFNLMRRLDKQAIFPLSLSLRLLHNCKIQQLFDKFSGVCSSQNISQQQQSLKTILLSNRKGNIVDEIEQCITKSRFIVLIYQQLNKKIMKDIMSMDDGKKYIIRTIIQINDHQLDEFIVSSSLDGKDMKEIVLFFAKNFELKKLAKIINKCQVVWI